MTSKNSSLDNYLKSHVAGKGSSFTHTRIGDKTLKIYGGSYSIRDNKQFIDTYFDKVFVKHEKEYLTEKQLIEDGPILIDIDLRYDQSVTERQHSGDHVLDCVMLYADKIERDVEYKRWRRNRCIRNGEGRRQPHGYKNERWNSYYLSV